MKGYIAEEEILPSRFLTNNGVAADYGIRICDDGLMPLFIGDSYSAEAPIPSITADPQPLAKVGEPVPVICLGHSQNRTTLLQLGAAVVRGDLLAPNTTNDGTGIPAVVGKWVGAVADESGAAGELIRVTQVSPFKLT